MFYWLADLSGTISALNIFRYLTVRTAGATITAGAPLSRAILGGTGAFAGVRGEAVTTRNADGSYRDELTILGMGMTQVAETLRYTTAEIGRAHV